MRVLICGDVVGRSGRRAVIDQLPRLRYLLGQRSFESLCQHQVTEQTCLVFSLQDVGRRDVPMNDFLRISFL